MVLTACQIQHQTAIPRAATSGSLIEQFHRALNCHTECPRNDAGTFAPLAPVVVVGGSEAPVAAVYLAEKPAADRA